MIVKQTSRDRLMFSAIINILVGVNCSGITNLLSVFMIRFVLPRMERRTYFVLSYDTAFSSCDGEIKAGEAESLV